MTTMAGSEMVPIGHGTFFSNKKHFFNHLDHEIRTRFSTTIWFLHFSVTSCCFKNLGLRSMNLTLNFE